MSYAQPYFLWDRPGFCFLFTFLLRYRCSRFLTVKSTYLALLQRLLNLIIYSGREEACYPKSAAIILDTVRLMRLEAQKLINLRRYNIFFLSYLPDERMTNGVNANKTCVEFMSKSDCRKKVRPVFASRLETLSKITISKPVTPYEYRGTADIN